MTMKRFVFGWVFVMVLALPQLAWGKVGVVSFEDVLEKTRQGKKISAEIAAYFKGKQGSIDKRKESLQNEEKQMVEAFKQLEASKTILKDSIYRSRKAALEEKYRKLLLKGQQLMQEVNTENESLQKRRYTLLQPLRTTFISAVNAIAQKQGLDIVIERTAVYYHKSALDITPAVITKIDSETK
jgi:outer membrane protein